jgi:hypothetical protein
MPALLATPSEAKVGGGVMVDVEAKCTSSIEFNASPCASHSEASCIFKL